MICSEQPAPIHFGLKLYMSNNKQKHLKPCFVLSHSSSHHFSVFIVHRWFISNKIKEVDCFTRFLSDRDIYLAVFNFEWLLRPDYPKALHSHYIRSLFLPLHGRYLPTCSGSRQRVTYRYQSHEHLWAVSCSHSDCKDHSVSGVCRRRVFRPRGSGSSFREKLNQVVLSWAFRSLNSNLKLKLCLKPGI